MKKYQDESEFVNNFAKDAKVEIKNGNAYECEVNGISVVVSAMDNNNASKVTIYTGSVDGIEFSGSITALKKRLNVTYVKEYNRSGEASTKVAIKSDEELQQTAETAAKRVKFAVETLSKYSNTFAIPVEVLLNDGQDRETNEGVTVHLSTYDLIFEALKHKRDDEVERRANEAKKKAEEVEKKLQAAKAKLEQQIAEMQAKLAKM